uniref:Ubiquitin-like protease family profile domain-containing protein n=1 Tax=Oryza meridionalis TaxID=40149 RepID=A0A0E0FBD3_9ORYZ
MKPSSGDLNGGGTSAKRSQTDVASQQNGETLDGVIEDEVFVNLPQYTPSGKSQEKDPKTANKRKHDPPVTPSFTPQHAFKVSVNENGFAKVDTNYLKKSYDYAVVVDIEDVLLTSHFLRPTVDGGWIYDHVIDAYAYISNIENDKVAVVSTKQSQKFLCDFGGFDAKYKLKWVDNIGVKCVTRNMKSYDYAVVVDIEDVLLTSHFLRPTVDGGWIYDHVIDAYAYISNIENDKVAVVSTKQSQKFLCDFGGFDAKYELKWVDNIGVKCVTRNMVDALQSCVETAVEAGVVSIMDSIDMTKWPRRRYTDIPQQKDTQSCGVYVIKYMLTRDGDQIAEDFTNVCPTNLFSYVVMLKI